MSSATALWQFTISVPWTEQDIRCWSWLKKVGRELPQAVNWPFCDNTVTPLWVEWMPSSTNTVTKLEVKANDGPVLVHIPQGQRYNPQYRSNCKRSGRVSVRCWRWISHEGAGVLHLIQGHLDGLLYQHILQNVMVLSVRMFYPDGIIHLQQDHSSIRDSRMVQEWLSRQADVGFLDRPPQTPDMNPIENMWSEMKRTTQETWPVLLPRNSDELWTLVLDAWDEVASSTRYIQSLIESVTRRMKSVFEAEGSWTSY